MPAKKMDKKQLDQYRKLLMKIKEDTVHDIRNMTKDHSPDAIDHQGDASGHALHMADVATDMYDKEFTLGLASNERELLNKVEAALIRINEKNYGSCSVCDKPIPVARLKAIPYTETCLKCQEEIEKNS